jgi:hypothetical protein
MARRQWRPGSSLQGRDGIRSSSLTWEASAVDQPLYRVGVAGAGIPVPTRQRKVALLPTDRMDGKGTGPAALVPRAVMPHVVRISRRYLKPLSGVFAGAFDAV